MCTNIIFPHCTYNALLHLVKYIYTSPVTNKAAPAPAPDCVITVEEECEERTEVACSVLYCNVLYCIVLY